MRRRKVCRKKVRRKKACRKKARRKKEGGSGSFPGPPLLFFYRFGTISPGFLKMWPAGTTPRTMDRG